MADSSSVSASLGGATHLRASSARTQFLAQGGLKSGLPAFPIRHDRKEQTSPLLSVIRVESMAKLMTDYVVD